MVPRDWIRAVIVPIHKKGSKKLCKNYRGSSLLGVPGKVFASILNHAVYLFLSLFASRTVYPLIQTTNSLTVHLSSR